MNVRNVAYLGLCLAACQTGVPLAENAAAAPAPAAPGRAVTPLQMAVDRPAVRDAAEPPWSLTASDGSGLVLDRIDARAVVEGPLAFTELHLYFHNPEARIREGTFTITLPTGAAVSRFAMEHNGAWQEAEVVEKTKARRVYDDFLHRKQDPALLEKAAGNQFSARVFPIPAKADKHLVMSFSQELLDRGYALPLRGLPKVGRVDVQLDAAQLDGTRKRQTLSERDWQPDRDFAAAVPSTAAAVTAGQLVVGTFPLLDRGAASGPPDTPNRLTLAVDTSASRALGFAGYVASVHGLIDALRSRYGDPLVLQVVAFDQDTQLIFDGLAADYGAAQDRALLTRGAAGASDVGQLVEVLGSPARPAHRRVVVVTDGVVTAGPDTPALTAAIARLSVDRLDVVLAGGIRDERTATAMVRAGLARSGDVHDLDDGAAAVAAGLGEQVRVDVAIDIPGATWVYPRKVPAVRSGSSLMVHARLARPATSIDVVIGGVSRTVVLGAATPALVDRSVAGAEIAELETQLDGTTDPAARLALGGDIARRSVRARVLSSQTSMLVLETEADYQRYQIERTALADILEVGAGGIETTERTGLQLAAAPPRPPAPPPTTEDGHFASITGSGDIASGFDDIDIQGGLLANQSDDTPGGFGVGRSGMGPGGGGTGWGTIGTGRYATIGRGGGGGAGYGVGSGRGGMRGRTAAVPSVRLGAPTVTGELDKAIIRRYIRRNLPRITYCYERALPANPTLAGAVSVAFTITTTGTVADATATGLDPAVAACLKSVLESTRFPSAPGIVRVTYPFAFTPRDGDPLPDTQVVAAPPAAADPPAPREPPDPPEDRSRSALTGKLADVTTALRARKVDHALALARAWHADAPGDVLALIALGEVLEAKKDTAAAARIYGSIIDLFPARADLRRFAGERLERLGAPARALAIDTYRRAVADRPDHPSGHRLLAYALLRSGDHAGAFTAILAAVDAGNPRGRFPGIERILEEDAGMIAATHLAAGGPRATILEALDARKLTLAVEPSTRFIMYWETDANDVDFHIRDARGGHAWYERPELSSGGELYADVTTGYGPECFTIRGRPKAGPYKLSINYYSQGPMGYGMGLLQIQRFDGKTLSFEDRPYVIMTDHAFVDLGTYR